MTALAQTILHPPRLRSDAVVYGLMQEETAAKKFMEVTGLKVSSCGLFIHKEEGYSYLAASPDGLVGDDALLEMEGK